MHNYSAFSVMYTSGVITIVDPSDGQFHQVHLMKEVRIHSSRREHDFVNDFRKRKLGLDVSEAETERQKRRLKSLLAQSLFLQQVIFQ